MSNTPAFQYYPADMATDTEVMFWSMEQMGCYHAMIDYLWLNSGKIDGNSSDFPAKLCRIFRVSHRKKAQKLWENISKKFQKTNGIITHRRITKEMQRQADTRLTRQKAGKKGMENRWHGDNPAITEPITKPITKNNPSTPTSFSSSTTTLNPKEDIGIDKENPDKDLELELQKIIQKEAMLWSDAIEKLWVLNKNELKTFTNVRLHLMEKAKSEPKIHEFFERTIAWAKQAHGSQVENTKGLFIKKLKEETGFQGNGKLLK